MKGMKKKRTKEYITDRTWARKIKYRTCEAFKEEME